MLLLLNFRLLVLIVRLLSMNVVSVYRGWFWCVSSRVVDFDVVEVVGWCLAGLYLLELVVVYYDVDIVIFVGL